MRFLLLTITMETVATYLRVHDKPEYERWVASGGDLTLVVAAILLVMDVVELLSRFR
jgi:hypothetical protein